MTVPSFYVDCASLVEARGSKWPRGEAVPVPENFLCWVGTQRSSHYLHGTDEELWAADTESLG